MILPSDSDACDSTAVLKQSCPRVGSRYRKQFKLFYVSNGNLCYVNVWTFSTLFLYIRMTIV